MAGQTIRVAIPSAAPVMPVQATVVGAPVQATVVGAQPVVIQQQPPLSANPYFGRQPVNCICHSCGQQTRTRMEFQTSGGTWLICLGISCFTGCICLGPIAFCVDGAKDCAHYCTHCNAELGKRTVIG